MQGRTILGRSLARVSLRQALRNRMALYHPDFPVVVMWSEKSACTIAVKWFLHHIGKLDEALAYNRWVHVYENEVFKVQPGYLQACADAIRAGRPVIKFVRNPYARAYSGFLETCRNQYLAKTDHWAMHMRADVVAHLYGPDADLTTPYSFNQFANWLVSRKPGTLNAHVAPQFLDIENRITVEPIRLEDHDNAFWHVEAEYGLPSTRDNQQLFNSGHHHPKRSVSHEDALVALNTAVLIERAKETQLPDPLPEAIARSPGGEMIRQVCACDFSAYGYDALI